MNLRERLHPPCTQCGAPTLLRWARKHDGKCKACVGEPLTRAQQVVLDRLDRAYETPYDKRTAGTFRFSGRNMRRILESLARKGLLTFEEHILIYGSCEYHVSRVTSKEHTNENESRSS